MKKSENFVFSWKRTFLFLLVCLCITPPLAFADYCLTRGPAVGEIYFIGPTMTSDGIYHSTDFGKTAICVDSVLYVNWDLMSICADKTPGVLYGYSIPENLYVSHNYGQYGSWQFICSGGHWCINSGRVEGEIYDSFSKHSENYGANFIQHQANGFFGSRKNAEIDNQSNVGYVLVSQWGINDSLWLLISYDNFDSLEIWNAYNIDEFLLSDLSRGTEYGELYNFADSPKRLSYSSHYGETWELHNSLNYGLDYKDMVGGRQEGEVYIYGYYDEDMLTIEHSYIFHSTDYGRTFIVYHPFSKGEEPLVTNFSSAVTEGNAPLDLSFCNYSVGDIQSYEWDFDNDGMIDSYEAEPEYTYQDTGYYSVKLTIYDNDGSDEFLRENYIHVKDPNAIDEEEEHPNIIVNNTPNPFYSLTEINFNVPRNHDKVKVDIYNIKGQKIKTLIDNKLMKGGNYDITWDGTNNNNELAGSGIYFIKLETEKSVHVKKVLKINR